MKFRLLILLFLFTSAVRANGIEPNSSKTNENDSTVNLKSNIVIFKMITASPITNSGTTGGSLKKAGRVARTSYSHSSIENINILYKKKGI